MFLKHINIIIYGGNMKVILVNGSPHERGCTFTALSEIEKSLNAEGVETEIFWIGIRPISSCIACGSCNKLGRCVIEDVVNEFVEKVRSLGKNVRLEDLRCRS